MKMLLILAMAITSAHAEGSGHGSIKDLLYPVLSFGVLAALMIWKFKTPVSEMFTKNAEEVEKLFNHAAAKDEEAKTYLEKVEKKVSSLEGQTQAILDEAYAEGEKFSESHAVETKEKIERMTVDAHNKVEAEKDQMIREVNASLITEVVSKAKLAIRENKDYQDKASQKLMAEI